LNHGVYNNDDDGFRFLNYTTGKPIFIEWIKHFMQS